MADASQRLIAYLIGVCIERLRPFGAESWPHVLPKTRPAGTTPEQHRMAQDARAALLDIKSLEHAIREGKADLATVSALHLGATITRMETREREPLAAHGKKAKQASATRAASCRAKRLPTWQKIKRRFADIHPAEVASKVAAVHRVARECKVKPRTVYRALKREL